MTRRLSRQFSFLIGPPLLAALVLCTAGRVTAQTPSGVVQVSSGNGTTTWITADGSLWVFGSNFYGQFGNGTNTSSSTPVLVATGAVRAVSGYNHNLFLKFDRTLWAMGSNSYSQLGDGTTVDRSTPVLMASDVVSFAAGFTHSAFVKSDGTLWCVGYNGAGQLGDGTSVNRSVPVQVATGVVGVEARNDTTFFRKSDGTLWGMGADFYGQIGNGQNVNTTVPVQVTAAVKQVSAGLSHSLHLKTDGTLRATGANTSGALGDGTTDSRVLPVQVAAGVRRIAAGYQHSLFVTNDGVLFGAGTNSTGELGDNTTLNRPTPVQIATDVADLAAGYSRTFLIKADGTLWGTGADPLGDGVGFSRRVPVFLAAGGTAAPATVAAMTASTSQPGRILLTWLPAIGASTYEVWRSISGQALPAVLIGETTDLILADPAAVAGVAYDYAVKARNPGGSAAFSPTVQAQASPVAPVLLTPPAAVMPRPGTTTRFTIVVDANPAPSFQWQIRPRGGNWTDVTDNATYQGATTATLELRNVALAHDRLEFRCAVQNAVGGQTSDSATVFVNRAVTAVGVGDSHTLLLRTDGTLWVTGSGATYLMGQMVGGAGLPRPDATGVTAIAAGLYHSLFVKTDGTLWAVGDNFYGQLGDGTTTRRDTPVQVATDVVAAAVNSYHSLFIKTDGTLWAMGSNSFGELGDGTNQSRASPVLVASDVASVSAGFASSLFVKTDGTLWTTGRNYSGNLGDGSATHRNTPVQVASGVASASGGGDHSLFVKTDGTLWGMGNDGYGQLGLLPTTPNRLSPVQITTGVVAASAGSDHSLFVKTDGTLWAMGNGNNGQLGLGFVSSRSTPALVATGVRAVDAGPSGSRFICTDGSLWAMGRNSSMELGDGTSTDRRVPVLVAGGDIPSLTQQPQAVTVNVHGAFSLTAAAAGTTPLAYQWRKDGVPVAGAVGSSYNVTNAAFAQTGSYDVVVTNPAGSVVSAAVALVVNKLVQAISFSALADVGYSSSPVTVTATADSGLPVSFSVTSGPASISGNTLTLLNAGIVTVRASQAGDSDYLAAIDIDHTFTVTANFSSWTQSKFTAAELLDANISGPNAVYGQDGLPNLVKYALGLEPKQNITTGLPAVGTAGTDWVYTYTRPTAITDVTYDVEVSTDLVNWTNAGVIHELVSSDGTTDTWHGRYPHASATNVFFRLQVTR